MVLIGVLPSLLSHPFLVGCIAGLDLLLHVTQFGKLTQLDISGSTPW